MATAANTAATGQRATRPKRGSLRQVALLLHRYVGLAITVFLLVAGITGSVIVFYSELDAALNPDLMLVEPPSPGAPRLDPYELERRVAAQLRSDEPNHSLSFEPEAGKALSVWLETQPDTWREVFVNPYTGSVLGTRDWGNLLEGKRNLLPFIYRLHYSLALGDVGLLLFGIAALFWTLDCFVGAYLTFPSRDQRNEARARVSWLRRWLPAWAVRTHQLFAFVFTWHRSSGLWLWGLLLIFAWSGVGFNLRNVYRPVMQALTGMQPGTHDGLPHLTVPYPEPELTLRQAHEVGRRLMAQQAAERQFSIERELSLNYAADHGVFVYRVDSSLDISNKYPRTEVYFDGKEGRLIGFDAATGISAGNTVSSWLFALHMAAVGGWCYRIVVTVLGLGVAVLSVSGVLIWWRKRSKRRRGASWREAELEPVWNATQPSDASSKIVQL